MPALNTLIEQQYQKDALFEDIIQRLKEAGVDLDKVTREDIAGVDQFHLRGADISRELLEEIDLENFQFLDVGCGLGGPCRMFVDAFDCEATGIDINAEYIRTAQKLSELVGLEDKTRFLHGDACALPLADATYDVVWSQHVQMNIKDKERFHSEIHRVLRPRGVLMYYDIFNKDGKEVHYPVPWADDPSVSFLSPPDHVHAILNELGLEPIKRTDHTGAAIDFLLGVFEKIKTHGPPKLGLNVLMGGPTKEKLTNVLKALEAGHIVVQSGVYRKYPPGFAQVGPSSRGTE